MAAHLAFLAASPASAQSEEERELEAVRRELGALEERLSRQSEERSRVDEELKRAELEIAAARAELDRTEERLAEQQRRAAAVADESAAAERRLDSERGALAEQVRLSYVNGRQEALKLLLSQETPASFGRMLVYYDYFNRARSARVTAVADEVAELRRLTGEAQRLNAELEALRATRASELAALNRSRERREALLAELDASIAAAGGQIDRLRGEEQRLSRLVTELGEALAAFPVNAEEPFPRLKGRLPWPVAGDVVRDFGDARGGGVRWSGVLLESDRGAPVRSVYHGRVVFADWLAGLGLLLIIDHGDGYMTLYGHNDVLLKEPGDWVTPGEPIGRVGDTGGRATPSLYFEIRREGKPVDPADWIAG
ncbi:MAG: peptidoglycan DD-metalloendopeptidase family protein [Gammaproteobacteria bacterium]|nr:peptidoglycan DD-metalloendopeptidase family protein [Gammaproteobacteria bacterium]